MPHIRSPRSYQKDKVVIDMRSFMDEVSHSIRLRGGIRCRKCKWEGKRMVTLVLNIGQHVDKVAVSQKLKGTPSFCCNTPLCDGEVVFTHIR